MVYFSFNFLQIHELLYGNFIYSNIIDVTPSCAIKEDYLTNIYIYKLDSYKHKCTEIARKIILFCFQILIRHLSFSPYTYLLRAYKCMVPFKIQGTQWS